MYRTAPQTLPLSTWHRIIALNLNLCIQPHPFIDCHEPTTSSYDGGEGGFNLQYATNPTTTRITAAPAAPPTIAGRLTLPSLPPSPSATVPWAGGRVRSSKIGVVKGLDVFVGVGVAEAVGRGDVSAGAQVMLTIPP